MRAGFSCAAIVMSVALAACETRLPTELAGAWTPRSINDCSDTGQTFEFTDGRGYVRAQGVRTEIMKIEKVRSDEADTFDVIFRVRDLKAAGDKYESVQGFRFRLVDPTQLRLIGGSNDGRLFGAIRDAKLINQFDLVRCPKA